MEYSKLRLLDGVHRTASTIADFIDFDDFIPSYEDPKGKKKVDDGKATLLRPVAPPRLPRPTTEDPGMLGEDVFLPP